MLQLKNIVKDYHTGGNVVHALRGVTLRFRKNEFVSILGASGCGKTTMLNIIGGLDHYTAGDLVINGVSTKDYKDRDWDVYRNHRIGFVFQSYNLIPHQTVLTNVELALTIAGVSKSERKKRAKEALERVGLASELHKRPNQLSGGQMQRVAIARALVNNPEILLADEPTGALDTTTSEQIMDLIHEIAGERLVIMVTHNPEIAEAYSTRIVRLQDGLVVSDSNPYNGEESAQTAPKYVDTVAHCDLCKKGLHITQAQVGVKRTYVCPHCGNKFVFCAKDEELQPEQPPVKSKAEKKAEKKAKKKSKKQGKESASMSFLTSLALSARNLLTKKGRTAITSIAGSIGIISVCLVLALSNGFNGYIKKTQEDMLSSFPLEITETTMDMTAVITGMNSLNDMPDLSQIGDRVYVNSFLTNIAQGMTVTNDLSQEYLTYLNNMDKSIYTAIAYATGINLSNNLFTQVTVEQDGQEAQRIMSLSTLKEAYRQKLTEQEEKYANLAPLVDYLGAIYGTMPGTSDLTSEEYGEYVLSQYDVVGNNAKFPTKSNQAVLVVGGHNDVTDLTLAQLGLISEQQFMSLFPKPGEQVDEDKKTEMYIDFNDVIGKKFVLYYNDAVYTQSTGEEYVLDYAGTRVDLNTKDADNQEIGIEIEVTAVLRLKEGLTYGCLGSGLFFTEQLYSEYQQVNEKSDIVNLLNQQPKEQAKVLETLAAYAAELETLEPNSPAYMAKVMEMAQYYNTNKVHFRRMAKTLDSYYIEYVPEAGGMSAMSGNMYVLYGDTALRAVGGKSNPNSIKIYTDSFDAKEEVLAYLDAWNDSHEKGQKIRYTDTVGDLMVMVESILNAITYVLVAFTAISLVVSSVMIGIITYVSVVERTKEIGVLRSLGARKKDIKNLFNAETFIIGLTSGVFGVVVTYLISFGVNALLGTLTGIATLAALPIRSATIMVIVSIVLTLISGLIPAKAAAKKDPVIALRTE